MRAYETVGEIFSTPSELEVEIEPEAIPVLLGRVAGGEMVDGINQVEAGKEVHVVTQLQPQPDLVPLEVAPPCLRCRAPALDG